MPEEVEDQIVELLGCPREDILRASGKTGEGVTEILNTIVEKVPAPKGDPEAPLQCLIFDSVFNPFRGIIAYFKVVNGVIRKGDHVKFIATGKEYDADEVGILKLDMCPREEIRTGDVGYIISGIKKMCIRDRYDGVYFVEVKDIEGVFLTSYGGLGSITFMPVFRPKQITDLRNLLTVEFLIGETTLTDKLSAAFLYHPP